MRQKIKRIVDWCCIAAVAVPAAMCAIEAAFNQTSNVVFSFWAQSFAMLPGLPGVSLRRAFYKLTLDECADSFFIGFGALFAHRHSRIEQDAYVGPYAVIGLAWLRRGCLIGTRSSIVSGTSMHSLDSQGRWTATDVRRFVQVEVGEYAWIWRRLDCDGRHRRVSHGRRRIGGLEPHPASRRRVGNPARLARRLTPEAAEGNQGAA